jgi:hypothetical protein
MAERSKPIYSVSPEDSSRIIGDAERITTLDAFHRERMTLEQYQHPDPSLKTLLEVYFFTPSTRDPDITVYVDNILSETSVPKLDTDRHRFSRSGNSLHPNLYVFITTAQALMFSRWQELDDSPKKREVILQGVMHEIFMHRNGVSNESFKMQLGRLLMRELGKDIGW